MIFDRFNGYGFIHHRALNDHSALAEARDLVASFPERTHILEGDLCWDFSEGNQLLYFRHPSYVFDTLADHEIRAKLLKKDLVGIEHLVELETSTAYLVIELKVGRGDWKKALQYLIDFLQKHFTEKYWIDGFSLPLLHEVKRISPGSPVTLHTECVLSGRVLIGAPEFPPIRIRRLDELDWIEGIAIRRRGSFNFMSKACSDVLAAKKVLILSRLHTLEQFAASRRWGATAGYMHWDFKELLEFNDSLDDPQANKK